MKSDIIRYGIIGHGLFADRAIAPAIVASPNSQLVALQKRSIAEAREKGAKFGVTHTFATAEELVRCSDVDAVFIGSANSAHHDETTAAARAGKHVLVEKPMATNARDAERMTKACEQYGVKLMVGHVVRFSPLVQKIRALITSGSLGRIISARADYIYDDRLSHRSWLYDRAIAGGGPVFDVGVHCLDTLCFVLDDHVESVQALLAPLPTSTSTERTAHLNLQFSKGTLGAISCSFEAPTRRSFIEIVGTEGIVAAENFTSGGMRLTLQIVRRPGGSNSNVEQHPVDVPNLYIEEISAFSRCILEESDSPIPGIVGIQHQHVLDAAMRGGGKIPC